MQKMISIQIELLFLLLIKKIVSINITEKNSDKLYKKI